MSPGPESPKATSGLLLSRPSRLSRPGGALARAALTLLIAGTTVHPTATSAAVPGSVATSTSDLARTEAPAPSGAPGLGTVTAQMRAEIDRVVADGQRTPVSARSSAYTLATSLTRCASFEGQRYCLGLGWTTRTQQEAAQRLADAATPAPARTASENTGDLGPIAALRRLASLTPRARAAQERAELTAAARSVAKVWLIRHDIQGVELPATFAQDHPEALTSQTARVASRADYPEEFTILKQKQVRPQNRTYYCGPTTMQMIGWGWSGERQGQARWADRLRTTSAGTAITDMVRVVNHHTGYDETDRAGAYIVLDISDFTFGEWWRLMMKHVHDYTSPVVLHPVLLKQFYPYLDDDASGHFQVGRGFDQNPGGTPLLGYFEPWDQSRFDPTEPRIARNQWQSAYKSYRANQAHFQQNLGV